MEAFIFEEGNTKSFENVLRGKMDGPVEHFQKDITTIRTGRASAALVENILVDSYGQEMPIKNLATISIPDARLITIQPWDKSIINNIDKALQLSNLGVNPVNDGELIRIQLPQMSSTRREELVKELGKRAEENRIAIRNIRKEYHNQLRDTEKKHGISEDFAKRLKDVLQKITDEFIGKIDSLQEKKSKDILHV